MLTAAPRRPAANVCMLLLAGFLCIAVDVCCTQNIRLVRGGVFRGHKVWCAWYGVYGTFPFAEGT